MIVGLRWNGEVHPADILAILAFSATVVTAALIYGQLVTSARTNRARFLLDLMQWWFGDPELRKLYYKLDWRKWKFDPESFPMSEDEPTIDQTLYMFDVLGHLIQLGILAVDELSIIKFEALRVLENPEVIKYLNWLESECQSIGMPPPGIYTNARALAMMIRRS